MRLCAAILLYMLYIPVFSQNLETDILEDLASDEDRMVDYEAYFEEIASLREQKININTADIDMLLKIPTLTDEDAFRILKHRYTYGRLYTLYELKNVDGLSFDVIQSILPYLKVEDEKKFSFKDELQHVDNQFFFRYDRVLQQKAGYSDSVSNGYLGNPNYSYFKYIFSCSDKFSAGLTAETDAGEKLFGNGSVPFDFMSGHFEVSNICFLKNWIIGDYKINFGQGLVIGTSSIIGKSNSVLNTRFRNSGVKRYTSVGESGFFRGTGGTLSFNDIYISAFFSRNSIDANINNNEEITSFKTDGLHRTLKELEKKENVMRSVFGGNVCYKNHYFQTGITGVYYSFSNVIMPADKMYNRYALKGTDEYWNIGADYTFRTFNSYFFGEIATGMDGGLAILNGAKVIPSSLLGVLLLHRYYSPDYVNLFANGFSENSKLTNEHGFYLGVETKPVRRITTVAYVDVYYFPWAKYMLDKPSVGYDFLTQVNYNYKDLTVYVKFKHKEKEKNDTTSVSVIRHSTARLGVKKKFSDIFSAQFIADGNRHVCGDRMPTYGWILSQDIGMSLFRKKLHIDFKYAYFNARKYDNRVFLYEKDILYVFSIPSFYGEGHRLCINFRWQPSSSVSLYAKFGSSIYTDGRETIGTSLEMIRGNVSSIFRCLIRIRV